MNVPLLLNITYVDPLLLFQQLLELMVRVLLMEMLIMQRVLLSTAMIIFMLLMLGCLESKNLTQVEHIKQKLDHGQLAILSGTHTE